ncbi:unnamed protein product [Peniophora sp. CBMAI 1063]|nr:unnamed protein product [Peniophora sp. CBMAI 1063]
MRVQSLAVLPLLHLGSVYAHGNHNADAAAKSNADAAAEIVPPTDDALNRVRGPGDYAQRHMAQEHHIDSFDLPSFFTLHDLDRDGMWNKEEIEAVYGMHHTYAKKMSKDEFQHAKKTQAIVGSVLKAMDKDGDEMVSLEEFEAAGIEALPNFDDLGAHGHHYDVESEFFLHHEEEYHNTPETQTDESYVHAEDMEHFEHHEKIEEIEAEREAKFQGISVEEALAQHDPEKQPPPPRKTKTEDPNPADKFRAVKGEAEKLGAWGEGDGGFRPPSSPQEKMRKNLPYKYKFRKAWGDF